MTVGGIERLVAFGAWGAGTRFGLVLGGEDEAVPEEDFGDDGHVEEGEVWLLGAGSVEQFAEGVDGGAVEVEDFVKGGHVVCDPSEAGACACRRQLAGVLRVKHGARVEGVEGGEGFGFAVERCYLSLGRLGNGGGWCCRGGRK